MSLKNTENNNIILPMTKNLNILSVIIKSYKEKKYRKKIRSIFFNLNNK